MSADSSTTTSADRVIIIGGGFGGLATAVALHKVGVPSIVLEKSRHARSEGFSIGVFTNGWRALDELGVGDDLRSEFLRMERYELCEPSGHVLASFPFSDCPPPSHRPDHEMRVVMREAIPRVLTQKLPHGTIHFDAGAVDVTATSTGAEVTLEDGHKLHCRFVVLADGVHSKTAAKLHKVKLEYMHIVGWRAIVEMDSEEIEHPTARLAQGNGVRIGCIPVQYDAARKNALWYWFIACGARPDEDFGDMAQQKETMRQLVKGWTVGNLQQLLEATPLDQIKLSKIYQRQVESGKPWFDGCITGVGDACHATTPFLGQGGAMALESGVELAIFLKEAMRAAGGVPFADLPPEALCAALRKYETVRSERVAFVINKSRYIGSLSDKRNPLLRTVYQWLLKAGLVKFPIQPATFLDHTNWEPSGTLSTGPATSEQPAKDAQHAEE
ncbi:g8639 [Coccomyxa elongata]